MKRPQQYLLIDDDPTSNLIGEFVIKGIDPTAKITSYLDPVVALSELKEEHFRGFETTRDILLFLDLNMPKLTGWEFLEIFAALESEVKQCFTIYILTSSIEDFSKEKERFPFVSGFISKPLKKEKFQEILYNLPVRERKKTQ